MKLNLAEVPRVLLPGVESYIKQAILKEVEKIAKPIITSIAQDLVDILSVKIIAWDRCDAMGPQITININNKEPQCK